MPGWMDQNEAEGKEGAFQRRMASLDEESVIFPYNKTQGRA